MKALLTIISVIFITTSSLSQDYIIKIAGQPPGNVDYNLSKSAFGLTVEGDGNPKIVRFRITRETRGLEQVAISYSKNFTAEQRKIIRGLYYGNKIFIDKIQVKIQNRIISVPPVTFKFSTNNALNLCVIAGSAGGNIKRDDIINDPYIRLRDNNLGEVISFSFCFNTPADTEILIMGNKFSSDMLEIIKKQSAGWKFTIQNISIIKADNTVIRANSISFSIRE